MAFIETTQFIRLITGLVPDEDYAAFQQMLAECPEKGDLMVGCVGVRKVCMAAKDKGTSGGARIPYLHISNRYLIYLLTLFTKNDAANLSADGKRAVNRRVPPASFFAFPPNTLRQCWKRGGKITLYDAPAPPSRFRGIMQQLPDNRARVSP